MEQMYNFSENEVIRNIRTKFPMPHSKKFTMNAGELVPFKVKEILPDDVIKMPMRFIIKSTTPIYRTMDVAYVDVFWFFVPRRQTWKHWKNFMGEKSVGPREDEPQYTIPVTTAPETGWAKDTIADYMGIPTKVPGLEIDSCYARGLCLIWNEWFRDQNRQDYTDFVDDDANEEGSNGNNYVTDAIKFGKCLPVAKKSDYFTRTLLEPQSGEPVTIPLGDYAEIISNGTPLTVTNGTDNFELKYGVANAGSATNNRNVLIFGSTAAGQTAKTGDVLYANGLRADLANAVAPTVNALRRAFQLQKILEANNRSGSRYVEILRNRWNVIPDDLSLQIPEYLGGESFPLNVQEIIQSSATGDGTPLGQVGGYSETECSKHYFTKHFKEHGILYGLMCVRHQRTYQQGLHKMFMRRNREDFYTPEFQNLGEVPVYNYEIYAQGKNVTDAQGNIIDNKPFGYNEYGAEYRFEQNTVAGEFRSNADNSLDIWHYADDYASLPTNGPEWIVENKANIDRTLTVPSTTADQFQVDCYFDEVDVRTMPPHSIPGFIDHH